MPKCNSCGAEIIWCVTTKGKRMPVDAAERTDGTGVYVITRPDGDPLACTSLLDVPEVMARAYKARHLSHFATCPNAAQHRRPRQGGLPGIEP